MTNTRSRKPSAPVETPVPDVEPSAVDEQGGVTEPATRAVHITDPGRGPVYVDDGPPLTHPDTRNVSDSPLIRAYLDSEVLAETSRRSGGKETT